MSVACARVPATTPIPWPILSFVMRVESIDITLQMRELIRDLIRVRDDVQTLVAQLEDLEATSQRLLESTLVVSAEMTPLWDDSYSLCGDARCDGTCPVCVNGEYVDEVDEGEKYCRRGRR